VDYFRPETARAGLQARENRQFLDVCAACGADDTHRRDSLREVRLVFARGGKIAACASFSEASVIRRQNLAHFGTETAAAEHGPAWNANRRAGHRQITRAPLRRSEGGLSYQIRLIDSVVMRGLDPRIHHF